MPLTQKQMEYLAIAWQCFDQEPKIDFEKFRAAAGLSSTASARELLRVTKKKLKEEYFELSSAVQGANGSASTSPVKKAPRTPSTGTKRGGAAKKALSELAGGGMSNDDDDDDQEETPNAKRAKTPASTKKVNGVKKEPAADQDSGDEDFLA